MTTIELSSLAPAVPMTSGTAGGSLGSIEDRRTMVNFDPRVVAVTVSLRSLTFRTVVKVTKMRYTNTITV